MREERRADSSVSRSHLGIGHHALHDRHDELGIMAVFFYALEACPTMITMNMVFNFYRFTLKTRCKIAPKLDDSNLLK